MLATASVLAFALGLGQGNGDDLVYDELARRWLDQRGLQEASAEELGWPGILEQRFAHLALGLFDVRLPPRGLQEARSLRELSLTLRALLRLQQGWAGWVAAGAGEPLLAGEVELLSDWLEGWSVKSFAAGELEGQDLLGFAPEAVQGAGRTLTASLRAGKPLGAASELEGAPLAFFPDRGEFVEFACLTGLLDPGLRPAAWAGGLTTWLEFDARGTRLVALQFAQPRSPGDYRNGVSVGDRNPLALSEHATQVAGRLLLERVYRGALDPALSSAFANELVISIYGELDTRIDGDVRSRSSQATSVFIPGGNPNGGSLPATSAETRWRGTKGKDHFLGVLSQVQRQSGKKAGAGAARLASFVLLSDTGSEKHVAQAPFLGSGAKAPPGQFFGDYLELVRAYGVGFLHWLRTEAGGKKESGVRFAELLAGLGAASTGEELDLLFRRVYGLPLSASSTEKLLEPPTLEGQFLAWLAKR
jgi:hypothetical protein